jgi:hypothetical protein
LKTNPKKIKSVAVPEKVSEKHAVVTSVGGLKKKDMGRKLAAGRSEEPKKLTRGIYGSGRKLARGCRKVSRRAAVAWHKRVVVRKDWTRNQAERGNPKRRKDGKRLWKELNATVA